MGTIENINYNLIYSCNDIDFLINLFYEQVNTNPPFDSLPMCIRIVNRIKELKKEYSDEEYILFNELRNLYIFVIADVNKNIFHLKYETDTTLLPEEIDKRFYLGFNMISIKEKNDKVVNDFIAENMINDMFHNTFPNHNIDIEKDIHEMFSSKEQIVKNGINKSFIDVIRKHDPNLSDYVSCNTKLLKGVTDKDDIVNNYDSYEDRNEENRFRFIISDIRDFCNEKNMIFDETLLRLAAEYHIIDKIIKYGDMYDESDYCKIKDIVISATRNEIDFNYEYLRKLVERYLNQRIVTERISILDMNSLKTKLNEYISTEDRSLLNDIFDNIKTDEDFDYAIKYLADNQSKTKIILNLINKKRDM